MAKRNWNTPQENIRIHTVNIETLSLSHVHKKTVYKPFIGPFLTLNDKHCLSNIFKKVALRPGGKVEGEGEIWLFETCACICSTDSSILHFTRSPKNISTLIFAPMESSTAREKTRHYVTHINPEPTLATRLPAILGIN